jgi:hypothetical protein
MSINGQEASSAVNLLKVSLDNINDIASVRRDYLHSQMFEELASEENVEDGEVELKRYKVIGRRNRGKQHPVVNKMNQSKGKMLMIHTARLESVCSFHFCSNLLRFFNELGTKVG